MDARGISESRSATSTLATASSAYSCRLYGGRLSIQDHFRGQGELSLRAAEAPAEGVPVATPVDACGMCLMATRWEFCGLQL